MNEEISTGGVDLRDPRIHALLDEYWRSNLRIMAVLLVIWAVSSFGCAILFADWLNQFNLPLTGFPLGFWFAQQGSIVIFVLCILTYCIAMNRLDASHHAKLAQYLGETGHAAPAAAGSAGHDASTSGDSASGGAPR